jgi:hypothetical protein
VNKSNGLLALSLAAFLVTSPLVAKDKPEWRNGPLGDRFYGSVGYYKPSLRTQAGISNSDKELGALISFEDSLGLSDSKGTAIVGLGWRISKRNSLSLNYFKLDRESTQDSEINVILNPDPPLPEYPDGVDVTVTVPLSSVFNIESIDITYAFSAIAKEKHNLAIGFGLALQNLEFGFTPTENCDDPLLCDAIGPREAKATAPLPTLKVVYQYAINDKWIVDVNAGYFALSLELANDEDLSGQILDVGAKVRWKTWKHAGFNLGYKYFDVDLDYENDKVIAAADYDYRGFVLGVEAYY